MLVMTLLRRELGALARFALRILDARMPVSAAYGIRMH